MRIRILSDLHLEARPFDPPEADADLVILAGDIANGATAIPWARNTFVGPVLYVAGNHEYYDGHYDEVRAALLRDGNDPTAVATLDCSALVINGVRLLGCTLWSDYSLVPPSERAAAMSRMRRYIPDYRLIGYADRKFQPEDSAGLCTAHRQWLAEQLAEAHDGPTVVITHFVPHRRSIAPQFTNDIANPVFIVPMDDLIPRATLWIHGHTHTAFDYRVDATRIVCNPRGYPGEYTGFNPSLVIEI